MPRQSIFLEVSAGLRYSDWSMAHTEDTLDVIVDRDEPLEPAAEITSRFLFVDVAAQRAKQLRRGALPRVERSNAVGAPHKLERLAMEEVRTQLIHYTLPTTYEGAGQKSGKS